MNPSKFIKNSKIHQALNVLAFMSMGESELKKKIVWMVKMTEVQLLKMRI